MCLIVVGWQAHPAFPLVVAANRDEFYARPSAPAAYWSDAPEIIAGRDLEASGTWLGVTRQGRFAAVTNVQEPGIAPGRLSRGELTRNFLQGGQSASDYLGGLERSAYSGFNLLLSDGKMLCYASNRGPIVQTLEAGVYGLSNHLLDSPWPKLLTARQRFSAALSKLLISSSFSTSWLTMKSFPTMNCRTLACRSTGNAAFRQFSSARRTTEHGHRQLLRSTPQERYFLRNAASGQTANRFSLQ